MKSVIFVHIVMVLLLKNQNKVFDCLCELIYCLEIA